MKIYIETLRFLQKNFKSFYFLPGQGFGVDLLWGFTCTVFGPGFFPGLQLHPI